MQCAARTGFFLARRCEQPALGKCRRCDTPVCRAHVARPDASPEAGKAPPGAAPDLVCRRCEPVTETRDRGRRDLTSSDSSSGSSYSSSSDSSGGWAGGGGRFGGGGASQSWETGSGVATTTAVAAGVATGAVAGGMAGETKGPDGDFSAEDFAAFDDVSDFDRKAGSDGYDS